MTWKKRIITIALSSALLALVLVGCRQETSSDDSEEPASDPDDGMTAAAELIADIPTTQAFTDDEVPDEDIDKILSAGINAPSAINGQNWHFTAVTDDDVLQQIADSMGGGKHGVRRGYSRRRNGQRRCSTGGKFHRNSEGRYHRRAAGH